MTFTPVGVQTGAGIFTGIFPTQTVQLPRPDSERVPLEKMLPIMPGTVGDRLLRKALEIKGVAPCAIRDGNLRGKLVKDLEACGLTPEKAKALIEGIKEPRRLKSKSRKSGGKVTLEVLIIVGYVAAGIGGSIALVVICAAIDAWVNTNIPTNRTGFDPAEQNALWDKEFKKQFWNNIDAAKDVLYCQRSARVHLEAAS